MITIQQRKTVNSAQHQLSLYHKGHRKTYAETRGGGALKYNIVSRHDQVFLKYTLTSIAKYFLLEPKYTQMLISHTFLQMSSPKRVIQPNKTEIKGFWKRYLFLLKIAFFHPKLRCACTPLNLKKQHFYSVFLVTPAYNIILECSPLPYLIFLGGGRGGQIPLWCCHCLSRGTEFLFRLVLRLLFLWERQDLISFSDCSLVSKSLLAV